MLSGMTNTTYQHHDPDVSAGTVRAYEFGWRRYLGWCEAEGHEPWGSDPDGSTFAAFIVAEVRAGRKPNTISQCRAAITYRYRTDPALYGLADPAKSDMVVTEMKRLSRRSRGQRVAKAPAMTPDIMEKVIAVSAIRRSREGAQRAVERHLEFEATLRLMFDAALRCDDMLRAEWGDVSTEANGGGFRALYVRPGKTDDRYGNVSPLTWAALQRWRSMSPTPDGRISTARSARALGERIRRAGAFSGIDLSGHSPRRGVLTAAARNGASEFELMAVAGHKSPAMVAEYVDVPHAADNAVSRLYAEPEPEPEGDPWMTGMRHGFGLADAMAAEAKIQLLARLRIDRQHPVALEVWDELRAVWPAPEAPRYCATEGCAGGVAFSVGSGADLERWCPECRPRKPSTARAV